MSQVTELAQIERAIPLLQDLRASVDTDTFHARLKATVADGYRVFAIEEGDTIMGVLGFRMMHDICWGKTFYIDDLNVAADARGKGFGGILLDRAKTCALDEHCDHIRLCSGLTRADAHRFYEAHDMQGFSKQFVFKIQEL